LIISGLLILTVPYSNLTLSNDNVNCVTNIHYSTRSAYLQLYKCIVCGRFTDINPGPGAAFDF